MRSNFINYATKGEIDPSAAYYGQLAKHLKQQLAPVAVLVLEGHSHYISSVVFSHDGQFLATGSWDKTARLWDVASSEVFLRDAK